MESITVRAIVKSKIDLVWETYNNPNHVLHWNFASDTWHCPKASNHLIVGGSFTYRMEAKDGSFGFDFEGIYDAIEPRKFVKYHLADDRKVQVLFTKQAKQTLVDVTFDLETENTAELQRSGWQAILNQFKLYTESLH